MVIPADHSYIQPGSQGAGRPGQPDANPGRRRARDRWGPGRAGVGRIAPPPTGRSRAPVLYNESHPDYLMVKDSELMLKDGEPALLDAVQARAGHS